MRNGVVDWVAQALSKNTPPRRDVERIILIFIVIGMPFSAGNMLPHTYFVFHDAMIATKNMKLFFMC